MNDERRAWIRHDLEYRACGVIDTNVFGGSEDSEEFWPLVNSRLVGWRCGVLLARRFEMGTELSIELSAGPDLLADWRRSVVRIVPEKSGHWIHGCEFTKPLSEEELYTLPKPPRRGGA